MKVQDSYFRREMVWAFGWLSSGRGLLLLGVSILLIASEIVITVKSPDFSGLGRRLVLNVAFALEVAQWMLGSGVWLYFVSRRALAPFRSLEIEDLLVTPVTPRDLWPGLFMGPVTLLLVLRMTSAFVEQVLPLLLGDRYYLLHAYLMKPESLSAGNLVWVRFVPVLGVPSNIASTAAFLFASTAVGTWWVLPNGGPVRLTLILILMQAVFIPEIALAIWIDNGAVMSNSVADPTQLLCDHVAGPLISALVAWIIYRLALGRLHSSGFWNRLRRMAEN